MRFVHVHALKPGMIIGRDIIGGASKAFILRRGTELSQAYVDYLVDKGYYGAYIIDAFSEEVELEEVIDERLFLKGVESLESDNIYSVMDIAVNIVEEIEKKDKLHLDLMDLRAYDDYTYHHSVNVAIYCVVVGKKMGLSSEELNQLCMAAICHDLGKKEIPIEILGKPGRLTDEEYKLIQQHPKRSFDMLFDNSDISAAVRQAILCHHENENGSGYPIGKTADEIPFMSKIIHVVDVFDALTSKRPYKEPYATADAFEYLKGGKNILFNEKVVDALISVIPVYLAGTDVFLTNGEKALVLGHTKNPKRPIVKLYENQKIINLYTDKEYADVEVKGECSLPEGYTGKIEMLNEKRSAVKERKETVFIVDDVPMSAMQTQKVLQYEYDVTCIYSGLDAINTICEKGEPNLLIMDIEMPILDGYSTVKRLKEIDKLHCPVVFLTSNCNSETVLKCKKIGATDYILKPANPVYLRERVAIALKHYVDIV